MLCTVHIQKKIELCAKKIIMEWNRFDIVQIKGILVCIIILCKVF